MTVYPAYYVIPMRENLKRLGIVMTPSKVNPDYYTISNWDKNIYKSARKVKLFLYFNYGLRPLSLKEGGVVPLATSIL